MIQSILEEINKYDTIIIHRHVRPDPDALGSQLGLAAAIKQFDKKKNVFVVGEEEPSLLYLGKMDQISDEQYEHALVIVCDTANVERISDERYRRGAFLIKIDHHPNVDEYGHIAWVDTTFSSTSEMIVELIREGQSKGFSLNSEIALLLYAGIVGDTGRFLYPNTTAKTLERTGLLVSQSFDQAGFYAQFYKRELNVTRLEGYVLQNFSLVNGHLGVMRLTKEILSTFGVTANESAKLVNSFSNVEGLKAWVFFVEEEDSIRVRLRSKRAVINEIAAEYNGGGHLLAAGATVYSWEEAEEIIRKLDELCKQEQ